MAKAPPSLVGVFVIHRVNLDTCDIINNVIKTIMKTNTESASPPEEKFTRYSDHDLHKFDYEVQKYKKTVVRDNRTLTFFDFDQLLKDHKALTRSGAIILEEDINGGYKTPNRYEILLNKIQQWKGWKIKIEYSKKKDLENLAEAYPQF